MAMLVAPMALSCRRDPICDEVSQYRIEFDIHDSVNYLKPKPAPLIKVMFYDPETGKHVDETFMSPDGGYLYAIEPGKWDIVAYTMDAGKTQVTYPSNLSLLTAETTTIQTNPVKVISAPDHMFTATMRGVDIPYLTDQDPQFLLTMPLEPVCDSWMVRVDSVQGLKYCSDVNMYVFNQYSEYSFERKSPEGSCVENVLTGYAVMDTTGWNEDYIKIPFCTFGMPEEGDITLRIILTAQDGFAHSRDFNVTDQVRDPENTAHLLRVGFETELKPLVQGGLNPVADEWDPHREVIPLE